MPSSIFSSKHPALLHAKALVVACAVLIVGFELSSAYLLKHDSETYARVFRQCAEAVKIRPSRPGEPASVLMVGNSLLMDGVDTARLTELTSGQMHIYPIFLEATGYYDWFYGLQRLFREGARPQVVVLGVGVNSFVSDSVRQDYAPMMLFDLRDSLGVAADLKMDRTTSSNLLLAHSSVFWDTRSVLRTQILRHTIPHYKELVLLLKPQSDIPAMPMFQNIAGARLQRLRDLCEKNGAKLVILVPPTPSSKDAVQQMLVASHDAGVDTLVPIDPSALSADYYQPDELHLNSAGAALFTTALAEFLPQTIVHDPSASPE
jgi:hypothetical protein